MTLPRTVSQQVAGNLVAGGQGSVQDTKGRFRDTTTAWRPPRRVGRCPAEPKQAERDFSPSWEHSDVVVSQWAATVFVPL